MGFSETDGFCRKHPNQRQIPGICSSCLRERLSLLSQNASARAPSMAESCYSSLSPSPPYSSSCSPNRAVPTLARHARNASDRSVLFSMPLGLGSGGDFGEKSAGLMKSRSVAVVPVRRRRFRGGGGGAEAAAAVAVGGKKKGGFWKKLLMSTGKRTKEVFTNPISVRAKV